MKKFFLVILIIIIGIFIYLKVASLGDPQSSFNQTTRFNLAQNEFWRTVLGLHSYGDAREWYLKGTQPVRIDVVQANGVAFDERALNQFTDEVKKYTDRPVEVYNNDRIQSGVVTDADIADIVNKYRKHAAVGQPELFIIYAQDFKRTGGEVGKTYQEFGIVLSHDRLVEVTSSYPYSLPEYEQSTLLHEFGHQIGLEHNTGDGCIMNESVEHPDVSGEFAGRYTQTDFCETEIKQIDTIKANLQ